MEDRLILELFAQRTESAIRETRNKYGRMIRSIAFGILKRMEDAEECENDTYMKTWESIPPAKPRVFSAFLSKVTRNLSLDRYKQLHTQKRGSGEIPLLLDELSECIPDRQTSDPIAEMTLKNLLNSFLRSMKKDARVIFMRRYWYGDSVAEIANKYGYSASKVKVSLMRSRNALETLLKTEGHTV